MDVVDSFVDDIVFLANLIIGMNINHADVVLKRCCLGMTLHEEAQHRVVAMGVPPRQKDDMFSCVVHYLMSMISASG